MGAKNISMYATHAIISDGSYHDIVYKKFKNIYVTNSIPKISNMLRDIHPFKILKLDELIVHKLLRLYNINPSTVVIPKRYVIYVASENNTKLRATYDAIDQLLQSNQEKCYDLKVFGVDVSSDVSNQPINDETCEGCDNRLNKLISYVNHMNLKYDFLVSIENGIFYDGILDNDTVVSDKCQVIVLANTNKSTQRTEKLSSQSTIIPINFVHESISSNKVNTVGSLIESAYGYKNDTWHEYFTPHITRHKMIYDTIISAFTVQKQKK
jgi:non-canonical (house-cleaning) NTP pyrophosphatase